jgi:ribosomal protein S18 acetylase RimI-like enzyme
MVETHGWRLIEMSIRRLMRTEVTNFGVETRLVLGELVYAALPEFYDKILLPKDMLFRLLADQIDDPDTELGETYAFWDHQSVLGVLSVVPSEALRGAQTSGTIMLVRELNREQRAIFQRASLGYSEQVEPLASLSGKYLPRLAVAPAARGRGVARALMKHIIDLYGQELIALHVARRNTAVINLHSSLGFTPQSDKDYPIRVLIREPSVR